MHFIELMKNAVSTLEGKVVAFLGLSFKPNTDDTRATRALPIIEKLYEEGAKVKAYDPKAMENFKRMTDLPVEYCEKWEEALRDVDLVVVQSDWRGIRDIKAEDFKRLLKNPIVVDGRRTYDPMKMISEGVEYYGIGWKNLKT